MPVVGRQVTKTAGQRRSESGPSGHVDSGQGKWVPDHGFPLLGRTEPQGTAHLQTLYEGLVQTGQQTTDSEQQTAAMLVRCELSVVGYVNNFIAIYNIKS